MKLSLSLFLYTLGNRLAHWVALTTVLLKTDSTIQPPLNQRYSLTNGVHGCSARRSMLDENTIFTYFPAVCKGRSSDDVGGTRGAGFQEIWPVAGFKTGDFVKEKLGGGLPRNDSEIHFSLRTHEHFTNSVEILKRRGSEKKQEKWRTDTAACARS